MLCSFVNYAQDISLLHQFNGKFDFTMIGNTLNFVENEAATNCAILTTSSANLSLSNDDEIEKAYLYWAGSGTGDFMVLLNQETIVAQRIFSNNFFGLEFFSCFADVTTLLQTSGNATYTISDLDLNDIIANYCANGTNFGGWAIIVIYKNDNLPLNQLNVYDGLESVYSQNPELTITIDNLNVIDTSGAKIGFLAWEGDASLAVNETLLINGNLISNPPLNPITNVFNGTNSFTNSSDLYNMDLDYYFIEDDIEVGDTQAEIKLTSGQDFVMVNAIVTKLNSQSPDATVQINFVVEENCSDRTMLLDFTVYNHSGTGVLPLETPISLYVNDALYEVFYTSEIMEVGGSLHFSSMLNLSSYTAINLDLKLVVDDDGFGNSTVIESNEMNNQAITSFAFTENCFPVIPELFTPNATENSVFYVAGLVENFNNFEYFIYNRYGNLIFKGDKNHPTWNGKYNGKTLPTGTYFYVLYLHDKEKITYKGWVYLLN